jgi:hypothetical protein
MKKKLITCIECNSNNVNKSIMAPNVSGSKLLNIKNLLKKIVDMLAIDLLKKPEVFTTIKKKQKVFMVE